MRNNERLKRGPLEIKVFSVPITDCPADGGRTWRKINEAIRWADQVIITTGYPNGSDADECLIIYALVRVGENV